MQTSTKQVINDALIEAERKEHGWVLYKLPGSDEICFMFGPVSQVKPIIDDSPCFWISTFDNRHSAIYPVFSSYVSDSLEGLDFDVTGIPLQERTVDKAQFTSVVAQALSHIREKEIRKVVLSRGRNIVLPLDFNPFSFFSILNARYPDAFVYLIFTPEYGLWAGCTPELLLRVNDDELETMSLAGTASTPGAFSEKEKGEQELVSEYIIARLANYTEKLERDATTIKKAGELYHLCTAVKGIRKRGASIIDISRALHPTPAVCGVPQQNASTFIINKETHSRLLYSGFLGPVESENDASLFVNLRCMQISGREALLYAGAGIVEGSDPEAEWQETCQKMDTLLRVIFPENVPGRN